MNRGLWRKVQAAMLVLATALAMPATAGDGGHRRGAWRDDGGDRSASAAQPYPQFRERREANRDRWQQQAPDDRQRFVDQRRQSRQLSVEERRQLRRDILEANRDFRDDRRR